MSPSRKPAFVIGEQDLDLAMFLAVCEGRAEVRLGLDAKGRIDKCNVFRTKLANSDQRIYGVNTGFGRLADTVIPPPNRYSFRRTWCAAMLSVRVHP